MSFKNLKYCLVIFATFFLGFFLNVNFVNAACPTSTKLIFTVQPPLSGYAKNNLTNFAVAEADASNTICTANSGTAITISAVSAQNGASLAAGYLSGTLTINDSAGVSNFYDIAYSIPDTIQIKATAPGLTSAVSNGMNILVNPSINSNPKDPTSTITNPTDGTSVQPGSQVLVSGTAKLGSSSNIQSVQLSFNNSDWINAVPSSADFTSWNYNWTVPTGASTVNIKSRALDWSGRVETPTSGVNLNIAAVSVAPTPAPAPAPIAVPPILSCDPYPAGYTAVIVNNKCVYTPIVVQTPTPTPPSAPWPNGSLIKISTSGTVYMVVNGQLQPFTSGAAFLARGLKFSDVQIVPAGQISNLTIGSPVGYPDGSLIKGSTATVYIVVGGKKSGIPSIPVFNRLGLSFKNVINLSDLEVASYSDAPIQQ